MNAGAIRLAAQDLLTQRRPAIVVWVKQVAGSVPREAGTRMVVSATEAAGTVGGGHLEWRALEHARDALRAHSDHPISDLHLPLGPALGQCCGGVVTLAFERLTEAAMAAWPEPVPLFHLQLYGAGHVGRAIARALEPLDVRVDWIDEREAEFPEEPSPPHIRRIAVDAVEGEVRLAPAGAFYLVLTHSHDLDMRLAEAILKRRDAGWFGLIGSATKRARFEHRLTARGIAPNAIAAMACPIGLPSIIGKAPEVVAISVVAQLLVEATQHQAGPS